MKSVYEASNGVEAHMIKNLLQLNELPSEVFGEHLQGGVGDLQAIGVVRVMVSDTDYESAHAIVREWESSQPPTAQSADYDIKKRAGFGGILFGFIAGIFTVFLFLQSSIEHGGVDHDGDGRLDERWETMNNVMRRGSLDRNRDGKTDSIAHYGLDGVIRKSQTDFDFDTRFETKCDFKLGNLARCLSDVDGDGFDERRERYTHGSLSSISMFDAVSKRLTKKQFFDGATLIYAEVDQDGDGELETRLEYDQFENLK